MTLISKELIDIVQEREELIQLFKTFSIPLVGATSVITVHDFRTVLKQKNLSSYQYLLYCLCKTTLSIPEFRLRFVDDEIDEMENISLSYTVLRKNGLFNFVAISLPDKFSFSDFLAISLPEQEKALSSSKLSRPQGNPKNYIYASCVPQISFTSLIQPIGHNHSIPIFALGQFSPSEDKNLKGWQFPLAVQGHHSFIDGKHLALFFEKFTMFVNEEYLRLY